MANTVLRQSPSIIEGIGPVRAQVLAEAGIHTLADLIQRSPANVHGLMKNVSREMVDGWLSAAWLLTVDGVTPNIAEALVRDGVDSVEELGNFGLRTLELAVKRGEKANIISDVPSIYNLSAIQREAIRQAGTAPVMGRVLVNETEEPVVGAWVYFGGRSDKTDADGRFVLSGVPEGEHRLNIYADERLLYSHRHAVRGGELRPPITFKITLPDYEPVVLREIDGVMVASTPSTTVQYRTIATEELPSPTYLYVRSRSRTGRTHLLHLYRTRVEQSIFVEQLYLPASDLPHNTDIGQVLKWQDGQFTVTDLTLADVSRMKVERIFGPGAIKDNRSGTRRIFTGGRSISEYAPIAASTDKGRTRSVQPAPSLSRSGGDDRPDVPPGVPLYYFHGHDGCAACQNEAGYKIGEAHKPHPETCDCEIEELDPIGDGDCEQVYLNGQVRYFDTWRYETRSGENCSNRPLTIGCMVGHLLSQEEEWDNGRLRTYAMEKLGVEIPEIWDEGMVHVEVPPRHNVEFELGILNVKMLVFAELYSLCNVGGQIINTLLAVHVGTASADTLAAATDITYEPCE